MRRNEESWTHISELDCNQVILQVNKCWKQQHDDIDGIIDDIKVIKCEIIFNFHASNLDNNFL